MSEGMKVDSDCAGCDHCIYEIYDFCGRYSPGYYCYADHCVEAEYEEMMSE